MDDNPLSSQEIIRLDARALTQAYDLYAAEIYKYAYRHTHNALFADRTVGQVFTRLLEQLSLGRGPRARLRPYLFEIAYHAMLDEIRHPPPAPAAARDVDEITGGERLLEALWCAIREELSADQRHVIVLRFLEGFSLQETARIMGRKAGHIQFLQQQAVTALRRALERQGLQVAPEEQSALSQTAL
jgi:RNA polymerase sigma-70 factor (ECF subfamily)